MRLNKPRVRDSVKQYLRETADDGKLKRVMNLREYFYVATESECSEQLHAEYVSDGEPHL